MNSPLLELLKVHFLSFFREPAIIFWAIIFPILMAWVLGIAFAEPGETRKTVFITNDVVKPDTISERVFKVPGLQSQVKIFFRKTSEQQALTALKRGEINLYMEEKNGQIIYHYDPLNPDAVNTHLLVEKLLKGESGKNTSIKPVTTAGNRYIDFLIPGLIALGIMNSCMWGISYTLIEFRMKKLLRRMLATPMKKSDFLGSHFLFRVIVCTLETTMLVGFAFLLFDVTLQGSWMAFLLLFISGVVCFTGIAILVASRTQNTQVGNGLINAVILPMMILSGIFFSYHNFPEWAISVIKFLPLTILADNIRAVFNEGAGLETIAVPVLVLAGTGIFCYFTGSRIFKWY